MPKSNGAVIRSLRQQRGLKPGQLSHLADLAPATLYNIEGRGQSASIEVLWRIAKALDVKDVNDLINTGAA